MRLHHRHETSSIVAGLVLSIALILVLSGCAASPEMSRTGGSDQRKQQKRTGKKQEVTQTGTGQAEMDVYTVGGDDWRPIYDPPIRRARGGGDAVSARSSDASREHRLVPTQVQGFRVQLVNAGSETRANQVKASAEALFDSVYVVFQRPNYKVRAGNFTNRTDADIKAREAREQGFKDAWVVPSRVWVLRSGQ
ncbi:hypothetical protein GF324_12570 [bacterium]|nr:hypothetical protein [bacterium]